ncbi:UbiX family flavin prenyltransferase [Nocardia transvalensis]|uniref:UbiX family flavin prenyltransferase n=1 Tax=Nocardia transvalensis TaxID=37333 RepID=UPI00189609C6|nr:UbiX family flavin prenyltransferase [Nocardia transvalensis]MBF6332228.1 UbiX family flavin prenyltransferase [Nocardia transvalensis]
MRRFVVGMTGATGAVLGVRLLEELRAQPEVESHLVISRWARSTIEWETGMSTREVSALADATYSPDDVSGPLSSGSFRTDGMFIVPCSVKTIAGIATGYAEGLIQRAADVTLKEQRKLIIVPREAPLSAIHLENLLTLARLGVMVIPPMPAFYQHPQTVEDVVNVFVARLLRHFDLDSRYDYEWTGFTDARQQSPDEGGDRPKSTAHGPRRNGRKSN